MRITVPKVTENVTQKAQKVNEKASKVNENREGVIENQQRLIEKVIEKVAENIDFHHVQCFYLDRVRSRIRTDE